MRPSYECHGSTAVITLSNPPINGLSLALRSGLQQSLVAAFADSKVTSIIILGGGRAFSGGADIREFNRPEAMASPNLAELIDFIELGPKPVIAAVNGVCMGGGLELALGCHYRVALADAIIALPEVKLGLLPGAGGTQRLPRLVGATMALQMIVRGESLSARELAHTALWDRVCEGNIFEEALAVATTADPKVLASRRTRSLAVEATTAELWQKWRLETAALQAQLPAPAACVEAVASAFTADFASGIQQEQKLFASLLKSPASKALRHAFFAERAAGKIHDVPATTPLLPIQKVAVIGAGTMGTGIAMNFLNAGLPVTLLELNPEALARGQALISKNYESSVKKGKLAPEQMQSRLALLKPAHNYSAIADADLIIEAVYEDMAVKESVFKQIDAVAKPQAILATNTSTLDVDYIASKTKRPESVIGLHFFSPANIMRLLEVVRGAKTSPEVLATAMALAKQIKKVAVVAGVCDGFIGNRMIAAYSQQAMDLLEEGALPQEIDQALEEFGMAMGPFRMSDLAGNDIGWSIRKHQQLTHPDPQYPRIADRLCEQGRFGQKTGSGWYSYTAGSRNANVDPTVTALIENYRAEKKLKSRAFKASEIVDRCVLALVNEGAKILEEGIAQRASDIDMVYLCGYGFPAFRGGPMFYADSLGISEVVKRMQRAGSQTQAKVWQPAPLLASLAKTGGFFNGPLPG